METPKKRQRGKKKRAAEHLNTVSCQSISIDNAQLSDSVQAPKDLRQNQHDPL